MKKRLSFILVLAALLCMFPVVQAALGTAAVDIRSDLPVEKQ